MREDANYNDSNAMFKSGSTRLIRNLNQKHILNLVRMHSGITGREISNRTKLQISTVLYTLKTLRDKGLIIKSAKGSSTIHGGKPPVIWDINPQYGFVVGAELLSKEIRIVISNFNAKQMFQKTFALEPSSSVSSIGKRLGQIVNLSLKKINLNQEEVLGLGLGIPGSIDYKNGIIRHSKGFNFHNVNFKQAVKQYFSFPVHMDNDANAGALAIKWLLPETHLKEHIMYVTIQQKFSGMGVGFVVHHSLYRGAHDAAGEIFTFLPPERWSQILSETKTRYQNKCSICKEINRKNDSLPDISTVVQSALKESDAGAVYILKQITEDVSQQLARLINLFDPEIIFIGGDICEAKSIIEPWIIQHTREKTVLDCAKETPLYFSPFGKYSGAFGGAALVFQQIFS